MSLGFILIRLAKLCMSSSLWWGGWIENITCARISMCNISTWETYKTKGMGHDCNCLRNSCMIRWGAGDLRGLALFEKDTGQVEFERGFHHFDRQRFELQCHIILGRRGTGILLHIDFSWCQHLPTAFLLLINNHEGQDVKDSQCRIVYSWTKTNGEPEILQSTHIFNDKCPVLVFKLLCSRLLLTEKCVLDACCVFSTLHIAYNVHNASVTTSGSPSIESTGRHMKKTKIGETGEM